MKREDHYEPIGPPRDATQDVIKRGDRKLARKHYPDMSKQPDSGLRHRAQSGAEEKANSLSHGVGFLLALVAAPVLIVSAARQGNALNIVGASIFAITMVMLYFSSMLYHALPAGDAKRRCEKIDHGAIYLFIAGSYTPFSLGVLNGAWGWALFGLIWGIAVIGLGLKAFGRLSHPLLSTGLYLVMGWLVVIAAVPLLERVDPAGVAWLVAGGFAYTFGVYFYLTDARFKFGHFVWHLFVMAGTACHFFAVLWYAA
jgi:hemolysin III